MRGPVAVEARKLEYDRLLIPKQKKEGKPASTTLHPCSNTLESTTVADRNPALHYVHYTKLIAMDLGMSSHAGFLSSTVGYPSRADVMV